MAKLPEDLKDYRAPRPRVLRRAITWACAGALLLLTAHAAIATGRALVAVLLETSSRPASLAECERTLPGKQYVATISVQDRTGEPWHRRTCYFRKP